MQRYPSHGLKAGVARSYGSRCWEGLARDEGTDLPETPAPAELVTLPAGRWISDKEGMKPVREVGVVEIVGVEILGQFDTMYPDAGVLGQCVGDFSAGRSAGLVAIEHQDNP